MQKSTKKKSKLGSRILMGLMGTVVPVIVAACYGMQEGWNVLIQMSGRVVDKDTQQGIPGLRVACMQGEHVARFTMTGSQGHFQLADYDLYCDEVLIQDVDGPDVNGSYVDTVVPFVSSESEQVFELEQDEGDTLEPEAETP